MRLRVLALCLFVFTNPVAAGGLLGDVIRTIPGGKTLGDNLDDAHRRIKDAIPPYKAVEEGGSGLVRKSIEELNGETAGPALAGWIQASRQNVINAGVSPLPPQIRQSLTGFIPEDVLSSVRYRSGWGNEVALPAMSFRFGDAAAITLNDVVMFRNEQDAQNNPEIWAHELTHVMQYRRWGVLDFSKRYVKDFRSVEQEAEDNAGRFALWRYQQLSASNQKPFQQTQFGISPPLSNICRTPMGACGLPGFGPIGVQCYCGSYSGPIFGSVSP